MRRRLTAGAVVTATGLAFLTTVPTAATAAPTAAVDYTVVAADGVSAADAAAAIAAAGGTIVSSNDAVGVYRVTSADARFGKREHRVLRGNDQVAYPSEHQAPSDACALYARDRRLRNVPPTAAHAEVHLVLPTPATFKVRASDMRSVHGSSTFERLVDVAPGTSYVMSRGEVLAGAGQHNRANFVVG